jgi:hypothetical protein
MRTHVDLGVEGGAPGGYRREWLSAARSLASPTCSPPVPVLPPLSLLLLLLVVVVVLLLLPLPRSCR